MKYGDIIKLDESELSMPAYIEMVGNSISIHDDYDDVHITESEARKLMEVLIEHFN